MAVETLGEAWSFGWRVTVRCAWGNRDGLKTVWECGYRRELDMDTSRLHQGRDFPLASLETRLWCPRCGSRRIAVAFSVPAYPMRAAKMG
ncbi:MAG: hypothetical protein FJX62_19645 [Alphaproteobacteria bacterium]|nr:hypothetical protein [Alphaproteobacteria bacterium]